MQKVNIYSSHGNAGGSSIFFVELCNRLNDNGYDCTYYSPHNWPLDKCKSAILTDKLNIVQEDNIVIVHNIPQLGRIRAKKLILSSHEMEMGPISDYFHDFDIVHFVSDYQRKWHKINTDYVIIPPFVEPIKPSAHKGNIAGIVGHLNEHKQTELAIEAALKDNCDQVLIYGGMGDLSYFYEKVYPLLDGEKVIYKGPGIDKQAMYDSFDVLYNYSTSETYSLTISEGLSAGKKIKIPEDKPWLDYYREYDNDKILEDWIELIGGNDE